MITTVLCDLGGVVVQIDARRCHQAWSRLSGVPVEQVRASLYPDPHYEQLERGEIEGRDYLAHVRGLLGCEATDEELTEAFNALYLGVDVEVLGILEDCARSGIHIAALTNTNALHHATWAKLFAADLAVFDPIICSHELGARKPEWTAFAQALEMLGARPESVLFIDDVPEYVEAAEKSGMQVHHFRDAEGLREAIRRVLPTPEARHRGNGQPGGRVGDVNGGRDVGS